VEEVVWTKIDEMAPDEILEILVERLRSTRKEVAEAGDVLQKAKGRLQANIVRVEGILTRRAEQAAGASADEEADEDEDEELVAEPGEDDDEVGEEGEIDDAEPDEDV